MTLTHMKRRVGLGTVLIGALAAFPLLVSAQGGLRAGGIGGVMESAPPPTGPMSAATKAAAAVRASRAAAISTKQAGTTAASAAGAGLATAVLGYLWTTNNSPISNATVQLRNTVTGQVEVFSKTNAAGEFLFNDVKGGSYVIEYVNNVSDVGQTAVSTVSKAGNILAVGHPFTVAPGETIATFVRSLNTVQVFLPDVAGNIAASAVQSAASAGVTAILTPTTPVEDVPPPPPTELPGGGFAPPPPASAIR